MRLAAETGLSKTFLCDLENGKKEPCLRTIEILTGVFGLSFSQFFSGF
jgi:transcriptional regulator with XRE-family HTH domain